MENEDKISALKQKYSSVKEKHNLPSFEELNEDFGIEKAADVEVDLLIREIRRFVVDKMLNYQRFIESILNPVNAQLFIYSIIKTLSDKEKEKLTDIYKTLSKKEIDLIELDTTYSEEREAEFINDSFKIWQDVKRDFLEIIKKVRENWDAKTEVKNKNYFG